MNDDYDPIKDPIVPLVYKVANSPNRIYLSKFFLDDILPEVFMHHYTTIFYSKDVQKDGDSIAALKMLFEIKAEIDELKRNEEFQSKRVRL